MLTISEVRKRRPAASAKEQQDRLIAMSFDEAEKRIADGTASSQLITHFLKIASEQQKNDLELEKLRKENELLSAKAEAYQSAKDIKELYSKAITAMQRYQGVQVEDEYQDL